ncbi:AraC family transcriptional regulator [Haloferula sp. BvORR071]|uniref:helix-turn-helix domain-containing protein n=1 Tax=Haloferula sp. BvORR071 TaxID=1396141 RepID=UPI000697B111|nr:AraC family transcriptional regulator [Haloferula sp. BvORR071]
MPRLSKDQHALLTATVDRWLKKNYGQPIDLPALALEIGITRFLLCRLYHERTGKTIRLRQREIRIQQAAKLLSGGKHKISEVAGEVGYGSLSHFTKAFLAEKGVLPSDWRSRPRIVKLPETAGNLPAPGLTFVTMTVGEVPAELSYGSGRWEPGWTNPDVPQGARGSRRFGGRWQPGNAFVD